MKFSSLCKAILTFITVYIILAQFALQILQKQSKRHVDNFGNSTLLVTAHPDDETMFFGPTILNIVQSNKYITILCLSNGGSGGLSRRREQELKSVVEALGPNVRLNLIDDTTLKDGMHISWKASDIIRVVNKHISSVIDQPFDTLLTYDQEGISSHQNHKAIYVAISSIEEKLRNSGITTLVLKTVGLTRKYIFFLEATTTLLLDRVMNYEPDGFTLAIGLSDYGYLKRLVQLHHSQMVWFRQLYIIFSRYMFINDIHPRT